MDMDAKKMPNAFTTVNAQQSIIKEADSYLFESEDEDEVSYFHPSDIILVKVTSNLQSRTSNSNPASQVFSTRLKVITPAYKPIWT